MKINHLKKRIGLYYRQNLISMIYNICLSIGLAVGLFNSAALAADIFTVNSSISEGLEGTSLVTKYVPFLNPLNNFCDGGSSNCEKHGKSAVSAWINQTYIASATYEPYFVGGISYGDTAHAAYKDEQYSYNVFGIGMGMPDHFINELRETVSDVCGSGDDSLTTPGRTGLSTGDDVCKNFSNDYSNGTGGSFGGASAFDAKVTEWLTNYDNTGIGPGPSFPDQNNSSDWDPYYTGANVHGCSLVADPHSWSNGSGTFAASSPYPSGDDGTWTCFFNAQIEDSVMNEMPSMAGGGPGGTYTAAGGRDGWVDQITIGYVASSQFAQNFRSQMTWGDKDWKSGDITRDPGCIADMTTCFTITENRIEQGDSDMENNGNGKAMQVFQNTMATMSVANTIPDIGGGTSDTIDDCVETQPTKGCAKKNNWGFNVEQTTEGFFYSCINCNTDNEHAYTPPGKLTFQNWPTRPRITVINHADSATSTTWIP